MDNQLLINQEKITDVRNIVQGVYAPLTGFLREDDFLSVVSEMRLKNGQVWTIPIVLDINEQEAKRLKKAESISLVDKNHQPVAVLEDIEIYQYNQDFLAKNVFQTLDKAHPGVKGVYQMGEYLVGGIIRAVNDSFSLSDFPLLKKYYFTPEETKKIFQQKGWQTVVAFQTRNIPHRSHEALQKDALKQTDGLFIQPVIGEKKLGDFRDELILESYEVLINKYYPQRLI